MSKSIAFFLFQTFSMRLILIDWHFFRSTQLPNVTNFRRKWDTSVSNQMNLVTVLRDVIFKSVKCRTKCFVLMFVTCVIMLLITTVGTLVFKQLLWWIKVQSRVSVQNISFYTKTSDLLSSSPFKWCATIYCTVYVYVFFDFHQKKMSVLHFLVINILNPSCSILLTSITQVT